MKGLDEDKQKTLLESVRVLGKTTLGGKVQKNIDKFENELKGIKDSGLTPLLTKLADSKLSRVTGYSSGDIFAFMRISPAQMASDQREMDQIEDYLQKLQETVNVNNWDDIVDNFMCLHDLQHSLKGERSRQIFADVWKDGDLRKYVAFGALFQDVATPNNPPSSVLHQVKDAVAIIKKRAGAWKTSLRKESAAIDIQKGRQAAFFQLIISGVSGFFVFIATFFSGLLLDAVKAGNVEIPYEGFVTSLLGVNSTDLSS